MMGIDVDRVIVSTFFIGSALAGAAGVMVGLVFGQIYHLMGFIAGLKGFTAAVVGGIGSIPGAMLGGLLIGLAEAFTAGYFSSTFQDSIVFSILIVVMLVRPTGLLGGGTSRRSDASARTIGAPEVPSRRPARGSAPTSGSRAARASGRALRCRLDRADRARVRPAAAGRARLALVVGLTALAAVRDRQRLHHPQVAVDTLLFMLLGARPEHRRRLGRPARPRLRRLLRLRRLRLRDPLLRAVRPPLADRAGDRRSWSSHRRCSASCSACPRGG